jgi:hypothetical protein
MEQWVIDVVKDSPAYGTIIVIVLLGMKWHERISDKWLAAIKEIGEKCHEAHEKVATMYYEQSCRAQDHLAQLRSVMEKQNVHLEHFARAQEQLSRAITELRS